MELKEEEVMEVEEDWQEEEVKEVEVAPCSFWLSVPSTIQKPHKRQHRHLL